MVENPVQQPRRMAEHGRTLLQVDIDPTKSHPAQTRVGFIGPQGSIKRHQDSILPDFALVDVNPNSTTHNTVVGPRHYLKQVSAWYFGSAT